MATLSTKTINELLNEELSIPPYQRPYKWSIKNIGELLEDIKEAISNREKFSDSYKYRIGTVILHNNSKCKCSDIVDGQQRILSLILIKLCIDKKFKCNILDKEFTNKITQENIYKNYIFITEWFATYGNMKKPFSGAFNDLLEVVVISVDNISEAFQLFDSQNARGKSLDPHDLLKAYHLREMRNDKYEMIHAVKKWEAINTDEIRDLFSEYLFPIWNWSKRIKTKAFTDKDIDIYKGTELISDYNYAKRAYKASPYFQITEPFTSGNDFFEMVDHYLNLKKDIQKKINTDFNELKEILDNYNSVGFNYARKLFHCALLHYYDKFHNFDKMAVNKLFVWAFMLRVDMKSLGFDSINKYAIGEDGGSYSNNIPMFFIIDSARRHNEISGLLIITNRENDKAKDDSWQALYKNLKKINGIEVKDNDRTEQ